MFFVKTIRNFVDNGRGEDDVVPQIDAVYPRSELMPPACSCFQIGKVSIDVLNAPIICGQCELLEQPAFLVLPSNMLVNKAHYPIAHV